MGTKPIDGISFTLVSMPMGTEPNDGDNEAFATETELEEELTLEKEESGGEETGGDPGLTNLPTDLVPRLDLTPHVR